MGQISYTISLVMISLFTVAIIGFAINFAEDNNAVINIADDPELNVLKVQSENNISKFKSNSQDTYQSIVESATSSGFTTPKGGQFAINTESTVGATKNILQIGYLKIFGSGSGFGIFLTAFFSLIGFIYGMYLWKTWIGRNPD